MTFHHGLVDIDLRQPTVVVMVMVQGKKKVKMTVRGVWVVVVVVAMFLLLRLLPALVKPVPENLGPVVLWAVLLEGAEVVAVM